jgi:phenylacetic acid degradation protein
MDNARIGPRSFVSAAAFVKAGFECPDQSLVMGAPASVKRGLSDEEVAWKQAGTREYQQLAKRCLERMQVCEPLTEPEADRPRINDSGFRPKGNTL